MGAKKKNEKVLSPGEAEARAAAAASVERMRKRWDPPAKLAEVTSPAASADTYQPAFDLALIDPAPDNPRRELGDLSELGESMKGPAGIIAPLLITPRGDRYLCVAGHRRLAAAELVGIARGPVLIRQMDEHTRKTIMLVENLQRQDLTPVEEARTYQELVGLNWSQREIATNVGRSQSHIAKRLSLLKLPNEVLALVEPRGDSAGITIEDAVDLARLAKHPDRFARVVESLERPNMVPLAGSFARRQLDEIEEDEAIAKRAAELGADGTQVLVSEGRWGFVATGTILLGGGWNQLPLDARAHSSEPCHALGICDLESAPVQICTDRSRHPDVLTAREQTEARQDEAAVGAATRAAERAARQADQKRRQAFVLSLLGRKVASREVALRAIALNMVETIDFDVVIDALKLERRDDVDDYDIVGEYVRAAKPDACMQLALVCALHCDAPLVTLEALGYEPAEDERARAVVER